MKQLISKAVCKLALTVMTMAGIGAMAGSGAQGPRDQGVANPDPSDRLQLAKCEDDKPCPPMCGVRG